MHDPKIADRLLGRVETLVRSITKLEETIAANPTDARRAMWETAIGQYRASLKNIQEHGRETIAPAPAGVKIDVPTEILRIQKQDAETRAERLARVTARREDGGSIPITAPPSPKPEG
jgi:hypothetical protein